MPDCLPSPAGFRPYDYLLQCHCVTFRRKRAVLEVHDVPFERDSRVFERYLTCHACGARNVLRMTREDGREA